MKTLWNALAGLLRGLFRRSLPALAEIARSWCRILARWRDESRVPERERKTAVSPCVPIREPAFVHPDPMIYSQFYLMQQGWAVTWDNPDIGLFRGGAFVPSGALLRDTEYDIVARIWNDSTDAPIKSLPVHFSVMSFGIGVRVDPIGSTAVDLGVKGGPHHPAYAVLRWRTPDTDGHYCLQVSFDWVDDANPFNNLGQENTQVGVLHSPATFTFLLRNPTADPQAFRLEADSYQIPAPPPCGDDPARPSGGQSAELRAREARARHDRRNFPVPPGWKVAIVPDRLDLAAAAERTIQVAVTAPDAFRGRAPINVHAFYAGDRLAGGVTLYVERS